MAYLSKLVGMHQLNISSVCDWFVEGGNGNLILTCLRSRHLSSPDLFTIKVQVNEIFTIQFLTGIHRNTQSKSLMFSLPVCAWELVINALWVTSSACPLSSIVHS